LLVSWLAALSKDELVAEILELVDSDRGLRRRFGLRAAARQANVDQVRSAVQGLVDRGGFIEYAQARDYASDVSRATDAIDALIGGGAAEDAIYLARDAIDWVTEAYGSADDSSGSIGTAAYELLAVHLRACQAAPPDPVELGEYLAELIIADDYGLAPDPRDYAKTRPAWSWNSPVLIDALLDDGDLDAAWTAAATDASQDRWIRLADSSVATRPADALAVYLKAISALTKQTGDNVYHQIAALLL
jgi:hypothetical protein